MIMEEAIYGFYSGTKGAGVELGDQLEQQMSCSIPISCWKYNSTWNHQNQNAKSTIVSFTRSDEAGQG
jgi:hypothetical protein